MEKRITNGDPQSESFLANRENPVGQRIAICRIPPQDTIIFQEVQKGRNLALDRIFIRSILPLEVAKMYELYSEETGEVSCLLTKKEISFLEENLDAVVEEDQEFSLSDDDIAHLILCDAKEELIEKLKKSLGDDFQATFYYSQS